MVLFLFAVNRARDRATSPFTTVTTSLSPYYCLIARTRDYAFFVKHNLGTFAFAATTATATACVYVQMA